MKVTVKFFGALSEQVNARDLQWQVQSQPATVETLKTELAAQGEQWQTLNQGHILCAVNQHMQKNDTPLNDGDELAFFPPVTGG